MESLKKYNLLFLEDSPTFAKNTIRFFELYFKEVLHSYTIKGALELFNTRDVHIIFSDIKLEGGSGLEFVSQVRERDEEIPIFILSAHKDEEFLFRAIPLRLSGYLLKPLQYDEFVKVLKTCEKILEDIYSKAYIIKSGVLYDRAKKEVCIGNESVKLTHKEHLFLELLIKNKNRSVSKLQLEAALWDDGAVTEAAVKNFILRLRQKLGKDVIETTSDGYRLVAGY